MGDDPDNYYLDLANKWKVWHQEEAAHAYRRARLKYDLFLESHCRASYLAKQAIKEQQCGARVSSNNRKERGLDE